MSKIKVLLKQRPSDFIVKEILPDRRILDISQDYDYPSDGDCAHCILCKEDMDQFKAVSYIASALGISSQDVGICGTKDKRAVTMQRVSVKGCDKEKIKGCLSENPKIKYLGRGPELRIGELFGNHFEIVLRGVTCKRDELVKCLDVMKDNSRFPNYFGSQRFGADRPVSHIVGKHVVLGDFKSAVMDYVSLCFPAEREVIKTAREMAKKDLKKALELFPKSSYYERVMIAHLLDYPGDYKGAFFRLPVKLQKLLVHAYQSYLFNKVLDAVVLKSIGNRMLEIPLFGFGMKVPKDSRLSAVMRDVLKDEKISLQNFRDNVSRKLGSRGGRRKAFETALDFSVLEIGDDELNSGKLKCRIAFSLKKGTYATTFLGHFFDVS